MAVNGRRLLATSATLALLVGAVWLGVRRLGNTPGNTFAGPPRADYAMRNFTAWSYGDAGHLLLRLSAPYLQRRTDDASLYLNAPAFLLPPRHGSDTVPWRGQADHGWLSGDASVLKLQGTVYIRRAAEAAAPPVHVHTAEVSIWIKQNKLATDAPLRVVQGGSTMSGVGLRADLNTKHLELLHHVHGTFMPSPQRR